MSFDPLLELVSEIIYDFSQSFLPYGMFWRHRDRARAYAIHRRDLAKAILDHDPEIALVHSRRCQHLVVQWAREDEELDPRSEPQRSEEHTSELQSLMRISYAVFCLKKKKNTK